ncbi:transport and Golgi organization protein 1 homolog [Nephila pilipes]|uniref:Transport and Golgi organization protein 1 homolog n=1 Tax=Nephila pilipes TaxID=299642 RepID=A0A8X6N243_NEPPI|nr:transport and Golgi organization protein 1 homolog [Nephila pilipes]
MPKKEGPYLILTLRSPVTYEIADPANPDQVLGTYHISALKDNHEPGVERDTGPVAPLRKRGRPKKLPPGSEPRRQRNQRGIAQEPYYGMCVNPTCSEPIGYGVAVINYNPGEYGRIRLIPNQEFHIYVKGYGEKKNLIGIMANGHFGYVPNNVVKETHTYKRNLVPAVVEFTTNQATNLNHVSSQVHVSVSRQDVVHHALPDTYTNTYSNEQNYHSGRQDSNYYSEGSWAGENSQMYASPHVHVLSSHMEATVTSQTSNVAQQASGWESTSHTHYAAGNAIPSSFGPNVQQTTSQKITPEQSYSQTTYGNENQSPQFSNVLQTSFSSQIQSNTPYSDNSYNSEIYTNNLGNGGQSYYGQSQSDVISNQRVRNQYFQDAYVPSQYSQHVKELAQHPPSYDTQHIKPQADISDTYATLKAQGIDESQIKGYFNSETSNVNPSHSSYSRQNSWQGVQDNYYGNDANYYGNDANYYGSDGSYYGSQSSQSGYSANEKDGSYSTTLDSSMSSDSTILKKRTDLHSGTSVEGFTSQIQVQEASSSEKISVQEDIEDRTNEVQNVPDEKIQEENISLLDIIPESKEEPKSEEVVTSKKDETSSAPDTKIESDTSSMMQVQSSDAQELIAKTTTSDSDSDNTLTSTPKEFALPADTISRTEKTAIPDSTVDVFSKDPYKENTVLPQTEETFQFTDNELRKSDSGGDISINKDLINLTPNNTILENKGSEIKDATDEAVDTVAFGVSDSDYKTEIFSFDNVENMFDNIENINESDMLLDKEQTGDLDTILNVSEMRDPENSGYSNAYQIRNLKGEQNTVDNQNAEAFDEMDENATYSEFFWHQSIENSLGAIRSFIEVLLPWIPEPVYSLIMDLESKGISPRVPVFTALSAIPCLFLIVTVVYIKEKSKEKKLNTQLALAEKNIYTLSAEKNILEEKFEKAEVEIELSKTTISSERKFYEDLKLEVVNLNQDLEKANLKLESKEKTIMSLKEYEKEFKELTADKEKVISELTEEKHQLISQLNNQDETVIQLTNQLQEIEKELKELQEEKLQYIKTNEVYEEKLSQLQQNCNQLLKEAEIWNLRLNELNSKLNEESQAKLDLEESLKTKDSDIKALTFLVESFQSFEELEDIDGDEHKSKKEKLQLLLNSAAISINLQNQEEENKMAMEKLVEEKNKVLDMEVELLEAKSEIDKLKLSYNRALQDKTEAQTKLDVLTNYFKDKEIQLQKQLGAQEVFREKREKDADSAERRICLIEQENASYKSQVASMKQEMEETERNLKSQIAVQEKKAHENWIAARASERKLEDMKQEVTQLRQKLTLMEREQGSFLNSTRDDIIRPIPQRIAGAHDETVNSQEMNNSIDEQHMYRMPPIPPMLLPDMPRDRPLPPLPPIPPPPFEPPMFAPPPFGHFPPRDPMFSSEFRVTPPEFVRGRASTPPRGRQSAVTDGEAGPRQSSPLGSEMRESRNSTPPHSLPDFHDIPPPPPPRPFFPHHRFAFRPPFRREFAQGPRPDYQMENSSARGTQSSSVSQDNWPPTNSRV